MFMVSARTVLELGSELISSDAIAFYELIKNGFDANSKDGVTIHFDIVLGRRDYEELSRLTAIALKDTASGKVEFNELKDRLLRRLNVSEVDEGYAANAFAQSMKLIESCSSLGELPLTLDNIYSLNRLQISDTGTGMSMTQLKSVFLVIGTPSRKKVVDEAVSSSSKSPPPLGEKGIGRLSAMRLGDVLEVITATKTDVTTNRLTINWSEFDVPGKMIEDIAIEPFKGKEKKDTGYHGTQIIIHNLYADWSEKRIERLVADDISLLANPLGQAKNKRIAIYWNGKRKPIIRLDRDFLSLANAKITGEYSMSDDGAELKLRFEMSNLGFEHSKEISIEHLTNADLTAALVGPPGKRKRMNKRDSDYHALNTIGPFSFEFYWFNRSRKGKSNSEHKALINLLDQWAGVRLYRDGFRVYPYGDEFDDWLELDPNALRSKGYKLNRLQVVGQVDISRVQNPYLVDQTNREGLRQSPEEAVFIETLQFSVERLRGEMNRITREQREKKPAVVRDDVSTEKLEKRMKKAIRTLKKVVPKEHESAVEELGLMQEEFSRYSAMAWDRISDMEKDANQMLAMAGIGLMVEMVAHELTRSAENALDTLNSLNKKNVPENVKVNLESLRASMKSISKRLKILDPLSVTGRQRKERFCLDELVKEILEAHTEQFKRHGVVFELFSPNKPVQISAVKGMVVQVLENLISNSLYWMEIEAGRKVSYKPRLAISVGANPARVRVTDNGPGVSKKFKDRIFDLFFSLKDKSRRRGLGLYIAREAAEHNGGELVLDTQVVNDEGRFTTFDYRVTE